MIICKLHTINIIYHKIYHTRSNNTIHSNIYNMLHYHFLIQLIFMGEQQQFVQVLAINQQLSQFNNDLNFQGIIHYINSHFHYLDHVILIIQEFMIAIYAIQLFLVYLINFNIQVELILPFIYYPFLLSICFFDRIILFMF